MNDIELEKMIEAGESVTLEFKEEFPKKAHDLAKEIAALASTQGGLVLLGVTDGRKIIGVPGSETVKGAKALKERVEGICALSIDPPVEVTMEVVAIRSHHIVVIKVPNSSKEVHFANEKPYIRCSSISRPATSQEVKDRILMADVLKRLEELEGRVIPGTQMAAGIVGQGQLATMNISDVTEFIARRERRRIP